MDALLAILARFCDSMKMRLAVTKTFILTNAQRDVDWTVDDATIKEVLVAKYLEVDIQVRGCNMVGLYEAMMLKRANSYAMAIMNLTRAELNRALIARKLWVHCAIPAILYCSETMIISKKTIEELEAV